jgi:peptide/nickel transport system substrate-binding protein
VQTKSIKWLSIAISALLCALELGACGSNAPASQASQTNLRIAVPSLATQTLDPIKDTAQALEYMELMYDELVGLNAAGTQVSTQTGVADSWQASGDGLTWTFKIRPGIKFSNGSPLTSADVQFSLDRNMSTSSLMAFAATLRTRITSIGTPNPSTVVIHLKAPWINLPYALSPMVGLEGTIVPKAYLTKVGESGFAAKPVGSGPYVVKSQVKGVSLTLARNPFWRGSKAKYSSIEFEIVPDAASRLALIQSGGVDIANVDYSVAKQAQSLKGVDFRTREAGTIVEMYMFQQSGSSPLANQDVREALNLAVDRSAISQALFGGIAKPASGYGVDGPSAYGGYKSFPNYPYDPARARQLLAAAGYAHGLSLVMDSYDQVGGDLPLPDVAQAVARYFENVGVKVTIVPTEYTAIVTKYLANDDMPGIVAPWVAPDRLFPDSAVSVVYGPGPINQTKDDKVGMGLVENLVTAKNLQAYGVAMRAVEQHQYDTYETLTLVDAPDLWVARTGVVPSSWTIGGLSAYSLGFRQLALGS